MRGFPLLNLLAIVLLLSAVLFPLVRKTTARLDAERAENRPAHSTAETEDPKVSVMVTVRMVHKPEKIMIGNEALSMNPGVEAHATLILPMAEHALEFPLTITWPEGVDTTMAEVRVEPDGLESRSINVWSDANKVDETLRFEWNGKGRP